MSVIETTSQRPEWEIANDARILKEAMDIQQDPTRLREAKNYIQSEIDINNKVLGCLLYTSPSPRDRQKSRMPSSA